MLRTNIQLGMKTYHFYFLFTSIFMLIFNIATFSKPKFYFTKTRRQLYIYIWKRENHKNGQFTAGWPYCDLPSRRYHLPSSVGDTVDLVLPKLRPLNSAGRTINAMFRHRRMQGGGSAFIGTVVTTTTTLRKRQRAFVRGSGGLHWQKPLKSEPATQENDLSRTRQWHHTPNYVGIPAALALSDSKSSIHRQIIDGRLSMYLQCMFRKIIPCTYAPFFLCVY